jgi:hypothetical protein
VHKSRSGSEKGRVERWRGGFRRKQPPEIVGSSYVVKSLEAALWALHDAKDFRDAVLRAVNLNDDADTTGAACGQLAGAYWGESGIPQEWRDGLARLEMIERALQGLLGNKEGASSRRSWLRRGPLHPTSSSYWVVPNLLPTCSTRTWGRCS